MRYRELVTAEEQYLTVSGWTKRRLGRARTYQWIPPKSLDPDQRMLISHDESVAWQKRIDRSNGGKDDGATES